MGLLNDATVAKAMDDVLHRFGFEREWLQGGPPYEPSFNEALERGMRWYMNNDSELAPIVAVSRRGTFHVKNDSGRTIIRGAGVGQLVRALKTMSAKEMKKLDRWAFETVREARAIIDAQQRRDA